jgi:maleate cis-trans isomerase
MTYEYTDLMRANMKAPVFLNPTPCTVVDGNRRLGRTSTSIFKVFFSTVKRKTADYFEEYGRI